MAFHRLFITHEQHLNHNSGPMAVLIGASILKDR